MPISKRERERERERYKKGASILGNTPGTAQLTKGRSDHLYNDNMKVWSLSLEGKCGRYDVGRKTKKL